MSFRVIIDKLKQNFLLKKFKNYVINSESLYELQMICIQQFSFFMSDTEQLNERFDDISRYISRKYVIDNISIILNAYYRWNKLDDNFMRLDARKFLMAWLIYYCPKLILSDDELKEKNQIYEYSKKLVTIFNKLLNNQQIDLISLNKIILYYTETLYIFLEKDKIDKINYYTTEWISLDKSYDCIYNSNKYDIEQKNIILENINNDKKLVEKYINGMFKNFDYNRLKTIINITHNVSKKIIDNYKKILYDDILNKKFDISIKILNDIKKFILLFNRKQEQIDKINDNIDGEYFINLIKNNIIDINDVKKFGDFMIKEICSIGSISCETENLEKWNNLKNKYTYNFGLINIIADMMIFCLELIDIIRNELTDYDFLLQHIYSNK